VARYRASTNYAAENPNSETEVKENFAPGLDKKDLDFIISMSAKIPQADIAKMYIGNYADLKPKQKRQVYSFIQAQRSKHAKEVFLKELSAVGRKFDQQI